MTEQAFEQKYAPATFNDLVFGNPDAETVLNAVVQGAKRRNLVLEGPYGTGKSMAADIVANAAPKLDGSLFSSEPALKFSGDDFDGGKFKSACKGWRMTDNQYAVIDEFDGLGNKDQKKVRKQMDNHRDRFFILTTNHLNRIMEPIRSRCQIVEMPALTLDALLPKCQDILEQEGLHVPDREILDAIGPAGGDMRKTLEQLEDIVLNFKASRGKPPWPGPKAE